MAGYFELYQDGKGEYRFRLKAGNHEVVALSSEGYPDKKTAEKGIAAVVRAVDGCKTKDLC